MANLSPRLTTMKGQWAKTAQTDIPVPPVPGTAYRNTALSVPEIESGQAYDKVYDSARHNEMLHQATGMALEVSEYGIPRYSELTDYKEGGLCLGPNGSLYQAVQANGPGTAGVGVKGTDQAAYWKNIPIESLGDALESLDDALESLDGLQKQIASALTDAPGNGRLYGRKDGAWTEVEVGEGGGTAPGDSNAMPLPQTTSPSARGYVMSLSIADGDIVLPNGGTWFAYYWQATTWESETRSQPIGVFAGGTTLWNQGGTHLAGFAWRIS